MREPAVCGVTVFGCILLFHTLCVNKLDKILRALINNYIMQSNATTLQLFYTAISYCPNEGLKHQITNITSNQRTWVV